MRWIAALIWRLPPRSSRWRLVLPELTGIGAIYRAEGELIDDYRIFIDLAPLFANGS